MHVLILRQNSSRLSLAVGNTSFGAVERVWLEGHVVILDTVQHVLNHGRKRLQIVKLLLDR